MLNLLKSQNCSFGLPRRCLLFVALWAVAAPAMAAGAEEPNLPWHLPDWKFRQVVEIAKADSEGKVNTGLIELAARSPQIAPDGRDIRVLDQNGRPVKFHQVGEKRERLAGAPPAGALFRLHFQVTDPTVQYYVVYFGNPNAASATDTWEKKFGGLALETRVNTSRRNAASWKDMKDIIGMSKWKFGEGVRRQINDSENPFGPNEQFISIYGGLIHCPVSGAYEFGTDSDDSSFLLIDGHMVAAWPGGHDESGRFDSHSGEIELEAGVHKIEYYHVQTTGGTLARAGWRPPGAAGFVVIPEEAFARELRTEPLAIESRETPLCAFFKAQPTDSFQFGSSGPAFATVAFQDRSRSSLATIAFREWDFDDGTVSHEEEPRHVFLGGRTYNVTLRCMDSLGFESSFAKGIMVASVGDSRVDVVMEMSADKLLLLPSEPLGVRMKCRSTGGGPLPLTLVTAYKSSDGKLLRREREALTLTPGAWLTVVRSAVRGGKEIFQDGELLLELRYMDAVVAGGKVVVAKASETSSNLRLDQDEIRDDSGASVVLRLSGEPYRPQVSSPARLLQEGRGVRILVVDDSLAGIGSGGYPDILLARISRRFPRAVIRLSRVGLEAGSRSYQPLKGLVEYPQKAREMKADVVIIAASLRDVLHFTPVERFERVLQALVDRVEGASGASVVLIAPPPAIANPGLSQAYAIAVKRVGLRRAIPVADAYSAFIKEGERSQTLLAGQTSADLAWREFYRDPNSDIAIYRISPTARGQEIIATAVEAALLGE